MGEVEIIPDLPDPLFVKIKKALLRQPPLRRYGIIGSSTIICMLLVASPFYLPKVARGLKNRVVTNQKNSSAQTNTASTTENVPEESTPQPLVKAAGGLPGIIIDDTKPIKDGIVPMTNDCVTITYHENPPNGTIQMQWKIDQGAWSGWIPLSRPCVLSGLSQGTHKFSIQIKDNFTNISPLVVHNFTLVDKTPPKVTKISGVSNGAKIKTSGVCITAIANDNTGSTVQIRNQVDQSGFTNWATNPTSCFTSLSNGTHTITTEVQDQSQNTSTTVTTFTVEAPDNPFPTLTPTPTSPPQFSPLTPTPFTADPVT